MARLTKMQWEALRVDYEVSGDSLSALAKKHGADKGNISKRAKKEEWQREKVQQLIERKVNASKELENINRESTTLKSTTVVNIDKEADRRLRLDGYFDSSIEECQEILNRGLRNRNKDDLILANMHSQATCRNRDAMLGKQPTTQVNIQNNNNEILLDNEIELQKELKRLGLPSKILEE